jgi:protein HIRA/HIR1
LSDAEQKRVFSLRYGIDDDINGGGRRLFVGENSGPKLIENALQYSLEEDEDDNDIATRDQDEAPMLPVENLNTKQIETKKDGKKRIRPVLVTVNDDEISKKLKVNGLDKKNPKKKMETVKDAIETAAKAASAAEGIQAIPHVAPTDTNVTAPSNHIPTTPTPQNHRLPAPTSNLPMAQIPHSTNKLHTIDLPLLVASASATVDETEKYTAECSNSTRIPNGSSGQPLPCTSLSVSRNGRATWKDDIVGTSCTAMAAGKSILVVGTTDGTLYLYGNSPTLGWKCSTAFRSHPPLVFGQPIVALELYDSDVSVRLVVVSADGNFGVYTMFPEMRVEFKGSILPPMTHMILSTNAPKSRSAPLPKLARVQITESGRLLLLLSLQGSATRDDVDMGSKSPFGSATSVPSSGPGGSIQGFVYHNASELWMRVADSRFVLSDFYTLLPSSKTTTDRVLATLDDAVRSGVVSSSIKPSRRGGREVHTMYHSANTNPDGSSVTRSHCEDRLACAMALVSAGEFEIWLARYVRTLVQGGWEDHVRLLLDLLLGSSASCVKDESSCWWLSSAPTILGLDRQELVKKIVIPEMSKNRAFQRLTNEISLEVA